MGNPNIDDLEREAEHLHVIISASEPWSKQYEQDPDSHLALIKHEAKLEKALRDYFRELATKIDHFINWTSYDTKIRQAYDINVTFIDEEYAYEAAILVTYIEDLTASGIAIGAAAGEAIYATPLGLDTYNAAIQDTARKHTAKLVKDVTDTTKKYIQRSIDTSIRLGESTDDARARINKAIKNNTRAATIARTESVTSYQQGMLTFGKQSGAVAKEYQAISGACMICGPLDGKVVRIHDVYNEQVGHNPPGHPNCRCGQRLIYQAELDNNPDLLVESEQ